MYNLSEEQVMFIESDLRARGVEMDSLRENLLDHICCILENELEANGDFKLFYERILQRFYKIEIREIETETKLLLQNKNYYAMKKSMIISGVLSTFLLSAGILLKFLHLTGAGALLLVGIVMFSLVFLPLMFLLRMNEKENTKDKVLLGIGLLVTALVSMGTLFKIMHWPGANMMGLLAVPILLLVYLPLNLVTGIRNPATKTNTIVTSILLVAGCGLFLSLVRSPQGSRLQYIKNTAYFLRNDELYRAETAYVAPVKSEVDQSKLIYSGKEILELSESLKRYILEKETGFSKLDNNFIEDEAWLGETYTAVYFDEGTAQYENLQALRNKLKLYNTACENTKVLHSFKEFNSTLVSDYDRVYDSLNSLVQLQLFVLQNERMLSGPSAKTALLGSI
jgi:hypothetical protein